MPTDAQLKAKQDAVKADLRRSEQHERELKNMMAEKERELREKERKLQRQLQETQKLEREMQKAP